MTSSQPKPNQARITLGALLIFGVFQLSANENENQCEKVFDQQLKKSTDTIKQTEEKFTDIPEGKSQAILQYKTLFYNIQRLKQSGKTNPTSIAAFEGELAFRKKQLIGIGITEQELRFSSGELGLITKQEYQQNQKSIDQKTRSAAQTQTLNADDDFNEWVLMKSIKVHSDSVLAIEYSPNSESFVTMLRDKTAIVWDSRTFEKLFETQFHSKKLNSISYSPDGKYLVSSSRDGTARVWDVAKKRQAYTVAIDKQMVSSAVFSPDSSRLAVGLESGEVLIVKLKPREVEKYFRVGTNSIHSLAFSPDGSLLLALGVSPYSYIIDTLKDSVKQNAKNHYDIVMGGLFSPDGKQYVTAGNDRIIHVYESQTRVATRQLKGHKEYVFKPSFSPSGKYLATPSGDKTIKFWNMTTGTEEMSITLENIPKCVSYSPDGKYLAVGLQDGSIKIFKHETILD